MSFVIRTTDIAYCKANSEEEHYDHDYYKYHNSPQSDYDWYEGMKDICLALSIAPVREIYLSNWSDIFC